MKYLALIASLLIPAFCFAQAPQGQNVFLLKSDGLPAPSKDSADIVRVITAPDEGTSLYNVIDYYTNGKRQSVGKSSSPLIAKFEGAKLTFFENGRRKATENYEGGLLTGVSDEYFPNGKLYIHKEHFIIEIPQPGTSYRIKSSDFLIKETYDSLGVKQISDGNGIFIGYNKNFKAISEQGPVKAGKRNGEWTGTDEINKATLKETYQNGVLIAGTANYNGITSTYSKKRFTAPQFPGGDSAFGRFLGREIRYPEDARRDKITGRVVLTFRVAVDGKISNIAVFIPVSKSIDEESIRVIKKSPVWKPATKYGQPTAVDFMTSIGFNLQED